MFSVNDAHCICTITLITGEEFKCQLLTDTFNKPFIKVFGNFNGGYSYRIIATNAIISISY